MVLGRKMDDDVQLAIELTHLCSAFHVLPRQGGLLDQDYYHILLLNAGLYGQSKLEEYYRKNPPK